MNNLSIDILLNKYIKSNFLKYKFSKNLKPKKLLKVKRKT